MNVQRQIPVVLLLLATAGAASAAPKLYQQTGKGPGGENSYTLYNFSKKKPPKPKQAPAAAARSEYQEIQVAPAGDLTLPAETPPASPTYSQNYTPSSPAASVTAGGDQTVVQSDVSGGNGFNYGYGPGYGYGYGYGYGAGLNGGYYGAGRGHRNGGLNGSGFSPNCPPGGRNHNSASAPSGPAPIPSITSGPAIPPGMLIR